MAIIQTWNSIILAVYDKSHLQVVYDKFIPYFLSYSIRPSRHYTRNLVTCLHIKSKKKPYYQQHIYDPSNKQKQKIPVPEGQTIFKCYLATLQ